MTRLGLLFFAVVTFALASEALGGDFSIADFGARSDGSFCTDAIARAVAACVQAGGGRVVVPAGKWCTGAIRLKSDVELHLDEGSEIVFSQSPQDYLPAVHTSWEGMECWNYCPLVYAYCCTNVAITGRGILRAYEGDWKDTSWYSWVGQEDGVGAARRQLYDWGATSYPVEKRQVWKMRNAHTRPHFVQFNRCKNIRWRDFRVRNSPFWTLHLYLCEGAEVRGLDVCAHGNNNDGIDIEMSRDVLVEDCTFDQGDDGVVIKSGRNQDAWRLHTPTENVLIRNCHIKSAHTVFGIGSEISGGVRNVRIENCRAGDVRRVLFLKTNRRRGGFLKDITCEDVVCRSASYSVFEIATCALYEWAKFPDYAIKATEISDIAVRNIEVEMAKDVVVINGDRQFPPCRIRVENVRAKTVDGMRCRIDNVKDFECIEPPKLAEVRLFFAGDSTLDDNGLSRGGTMAYPYQSWGTTLQRYLRRGCRVVNHARSGESTKSFDKAGYWQALVDEVRKGDFVAIEFGHNDQKRSTDFYRENRWADPNGAFRDTVRKWVAEVRAKSATPILVASICRATFDPDGRHLVDTEHASDGVCLGSYREAMREEAAKLKCDFVDMNTLTKELMERIGRDEALKFFVISTGYVIGKNGEPSKDVTHPTTAGAEAFARLFVEDVKRRDLSVSSLFETKASPETDDDEHSDLIL